MESTILILAILVMAILGKADSVAIACCVLLLLKLLNLDRFIFSTIENKGMFFGVIILTMAILIPIANGDISVSNIKSVFISWKGIVIILTSFFTTYLSGLGLRYLTVQGHNDIMPALIFGSVLATAFLGGVPVGPLITSGFISLFFRVFQK